MAVRSEQAMRELAAKLNEAAGVFGIIGPHEKASILASAAIALEWCAGEERPSFEALGTWVSPFANTNGTK